MLSTRQWVIPQPRKTLVVGVADLVASNDSTADIVTYSLGSCLGVDIEWGAKIRPQILTKIHGLKSRLYFAEKQVAIRESLHEQQWLQEAARFAGVDFGWIDGQVQDGILSQNGELQCARECYRRGMGYREFPEFLRLYQGRQGRMCR